MTKSPTTAVTQTALDTAVASARAQLADVAPDLRAGFDDALPLAVHTVARRLVGAACREDLAGLRDPARLALIASHVDRHAFDRTETRQVRDPVRTLAELPERIGGQDLARELADAAVNLALAYARRPAFTAATSTGARDSLELAAGLSADDQTVFFERLSTEGHNLHPCGRTRLGWSIADALAHDLEAASTEVGFVAIRRDLHLGDDVGELLGVADAPRGYAVQPVHAWQRDRVVRQRYADLLAARALVPLDGPVLTGSPTAALRTVLLDPLPGTPRRYLKLSLDIQVTSTRRTISVASTRNGPTLSALLHRLLVGEPRLLLLSEEAGAAARVGPRQRDLAAIVRRGLDGRLEHGEVAVPGGALYATSPVTGRTVVAELVDRYAATRRLIDPAGGRRLTDPAGAAAAFLAEYGRLLLPPLLRLATRHGIALEAHLQNCIPTFRDGVPHRIALRDFAGLRLYQPRLAASGHDIALWPGSVITAADADVMRAKLGYTALQAHLGELVVRLVASHGLDEDAAWRSVREIVDETYDELRRDPAVAEDATDDHRFLTAPLVPHKALVRMRLAGSGDLYVPVRNPLR
ncbi:RhbF-like rhizobactin siderophore biosynthesis protein [Planosporangium flavigriseum]|nr:IucA/IucC family protein [Planosporangium flavigriseum]NJC67979.1 RhbF-like rhizobactin siderophore biosynthesis protein [Planosporangium flavigriseum]